jgi:hypothetical protein
MDPGGIVAVGLFGGLLIAGSFVPDRDLDAFRDGIQRFREELGLPPASAVWPEARGGRKFLLHAGCGLILLSIAAFMLG